METSNKQNKHKHYVSLPRRLEWHKLKPMLESAGHRVTALDVAASGDDTCLAIEDVRSMRHYSRHLLDFMASLREKVVLVGHSLGGLRLAFAMEDFPDRISVAVFVTAFLPDTHHEIYCQRIPQDVWLDSQLESYGSPEEPFSTLTVVHKCLSTNVYQLSPTEDLELAKALLRPGTFFREDLSKEKKFSKEAYGSIPRVYVVCKDNKLLPEFFQRWMIESSSVTEVTVINGSDHIPMFSKRKNSMKFW